MIGEFKKGKGNCREGVNAIRLTGTGCGITDETSKKGSGKLFNQYTGGFR